jgi:hypothetical protein
MRHVALVVFAMAALMLAEDAASAASKKHPRYARHPRPATMQSPGWNSAPGRPIEGPRAFVPSGTCIQDEGYGRWTYCGQGTPGAM